MKDLKDEHLFDQERYNFNKLNSRVITSREVSQRYEAVDQWIAQQKNKEAEVSLSIDDYRDPQSLVNDENLDNLYDSSNNQPYLDTVNTIKQTLKARTIKKVPQNYDNKFGIAPNDDNSYQEEVSAASLWFKSYNWGKLLALLIKDDSTFQGKTDEQKALRMKIQSLSGLLFTYQIGLIVFLASIIFTVLGVHPYFANPVVLLALSAITVIFSIVKLNNLNDGPLHQNFIGNFAQVSQLLNKENELAKSSENDFANETQNNQPITNFEDINMDDFEDGDDDSETLNNFNNNQPIVHEEKAEINHAEHNSFPQAYGSSKSKAEIYSVGERFLKHVYDNRFNVNLKDPKDILNFFAPMVVSYNDDFGGFTKISRDSMLFKNIAFVLGKYYSEIDTGFAKYNVHQKEYFYVVDDIIETALFYKVHLTLPITINLDKFKSSIEKLIGILRDGPQDKSVDVLFEMAGKSGYLKIMKLNKAGFMPLISTGDILRFKGMKTTNGKDIFDEITSAGDLKFLFGLQNAENAFVLDVGGKQNTNLAIHGFTGSGKTVTTSSWFNNILITHSPDEVGFLIFDPKDGSSWNAFRYAPHVLGYFSKKDIKKWPSAVEMLHSIATARQDFLNKTVRMENYYEARKEFSSQKEWDKLVKVPRLIVVFDEMIATLGSLSSIDDENKAVNKTLDKESKKFVAFKDIFKTQLGALANVTREAGITLIVLSQRTDDASLPRTYLSSASMKFGMRAQFLADSERLFGTDVPKNMTTLPTGSGYLLSNGIPLTQISTPLISGDPKWTNEVTKILGLAWTILYSVNHDENKEPEGYFFEKGEVVDMSPYANDGVEPYKLFNRQWAFDRAKNDLIKGDIHYLPEKTGLSFDITTKNNNHINNVNTNVENNNTNVGVVNNVNNVNGNVGNVNNNDNIVDIDNNNNNDDDDDGFSNFDFNADNLNFNFDFGSSESDFDANLNNNINHSKINRPERKTVQKVVKANQNQNVRSKITRPTISDDSKISEIVHYFINQNKHEISVQELRTKFTTKQLNSAISKDALILTEKQTLQITQAAQKYI